MLGLAIVTVLAQLPAPNVVLVLCDDLGYGDLSCYGAKDYTTPNIDGLARDGIRLTTYYSGSPGCSPARAALLTGCYPQRVGFPRVLMPNSKQGLSPNEDTLPELFRANRYRTSIIGKWHLGDSPEASPLKHGFETFYGLPYSNDMWPPNGKPYETLWLLRDNKRVRSIDTLEAQASLTTLYTDEAIRTIRKHRKEPFFLYLAHSMPHVPIGAQAKFRGRTPTPFGDCILDIDESVARIRSELRALKLEKNTIFVFTSDNGPWSPYGNHAGKSGGFRGHKGTSFEGGMRVPFIVSWPGRLKPRVESGMVAAMDIMPTLTSMAGISHRPKEKVDGTSMATFLRRGGASPRQDYAYYYPDELRAMRIGPWKLQLPHEDRLMSGAPGRDGGRGGEVNANVGLTLYNLETDPAERVDVASQNPAVVERILGKVIKVRRSLGDALTKTHGQEIRPALQL